MTNQVLLKFFVKHLDKHRKIRWDYGIGLRFQVDKEQHINMRIDYGLGKHASGVYVTIGEAF